jgi:probable HAF family extracellular repeat protein
MNAIITAAVPRRSARAGWLRSSVLALGIGLAALASLPGRAGPPSYSFFHAGIPGMVNGVYARLVLDNGVLPNWPTPQRFVVLGWEDSGGGGFIWTDRGVFFGKLPNGFQPKAISGSQIALQSPDYTQCGWISFNPGAFPPNPANTTNFSTNFADCVLTGMIGGPLMIGYAQDAAADEHAITLACDPRPRVNSCTRTFLPTLGGPGNNSYARGINNNGLIVGDGEVNGAGRAFYIDSAGVHDFDPGHPAYSSWANSINDSNQVVGWIIPGGCPPQPFLCFNGNTLNKTYNSHYIPVFFSMGKGSLVPTGLGSLGGRDGGALSVNSSGSAVGWSTTSSGAQHGFLYMNGAMTDLNALGASGSSGWVMWDAMVINDEGQIVGHATNTASGQTEIYILTP